MIDAVRVGPMEYSVTEQETVIADGCLASGYMDSESSNIVVAAGLPEPVKAVTLMHEVLHAILIQAGSEHGNNENLVECLAYGLVQLARDNPGLFGELRSMLDRPERQKLGFVCCPGDDEKVGLTVD